MDRYEADAKMFRKDVRYLNPLTFWWEKKSNYPKLYILAIKLLSVPATSVLSE
jgi:hypothetical protein